VPETNPGRRVPPRLYALDWLMRDLRDLPPPLDFLVAGLFFEGSAGRSGSLRRAGAVVNFPIDALSATASAASPLMSASQ
jgi:hypothetical protein